MLFLFPFFLAFLLDEWQLLTIKLSELCSDISREIEPDFCEDGEL